MGIKADAARFWRVRNQRLRLERKIKELKARETDMLRDLQGFFDQSEVTQFVHPVLGYKLTLQEKPITSLDPAKWEELLRFAVTHPSVVHRRVTASEVDRLMSQGVHVPGVTLDHQLVLVASAPRKRKEEE